MIWRTLAMFAVFVCSTEAQTLRKVAIVELPGPKVSALIISLWMMKITGCSLPISAPVSFM